MCNLSHLGSFLPFVFFCNIKVNKLTMPISYKFLTYFFKLSDQVPSRKRSNFEFRVFLPRPQIHLPQGQEASQMCLP